MILLLHVMSRHHLAILCGVMSFPIHTLRSFVERIQKIGLLLANLTSKMFMELALVLKLVQMILLVDIYSQTKFLTLNIYILKSMYKKDQSKENPEDFCKLYIIEDEDGEQTYEDQCDFQGPDLKEEHKEIITLAPYNHQNRHRSVAPGLNLQGQCRFQTCSVFQKLVWIQRGFGVKDIAYEINNSKCPICKQLIDGETIKTLGYRNCKVDIEGMRKIPNPPQPGNKISYTKQKFQRTDIEDKGKFFKFRGYESTLCIWSYLRMDFKQLKK